jgi:hypothetical protein
MTQRKPSIEVYMTEEQKVSIKKAAADCRLSVSEYCIKMIFEGKVNTPFSSDEVRLMVALSGMANNLNQAMKKVYETRLSEQSIIDLRTIINKIDTLLK